MEATIRTIRLHAAMVAVALAGCTHPEPLPSTPEPRPTYSAHVASSAPHCHVDGLLPDRQCTPGDAETKDVKVICGQSTRERRSVPEAVRRERFASYGVPWENRGQYELDHYVSLEIGGSNASANLWPEPLTDAKRKDVVENALHRLVCSGEMTVDEAQRRIAADWTTALP